MIIKFVKLILLLLTILCCCCRGKEDIKFLEDRFVYSSLDRVVLPDTVVSNYDTIDVDLNKDLITDFRFVYNISVSTPHYVDFYMYVLANGENEILLNNEPSEHTYALAMHSNEKFNGRWTTTYAYLVNPPLNMPWEEKGAKYIGYRIKKGDKFYTGWLKLEIGRRGGKIIFYDYAFRLDNGNQMYAGQR